MFTKDQVVTLRPDWKSITTPLSKYTHQLEELPADTEYTVRADVRTTDRIVWVRLDWVDADGRERGNCYEPSHFVLKEAEPVQTVEELIEENVSLNEQIGRLEAQAEELQAKIARKYEFVRLNTESIQQRIPDEVRKFIPYL